jgi:chromosome segregation protein
VTAIEAALGHHLQLVLTEQPETARQILAELNARKTGRASIAPLVFVGNGDVGDRGAALAGQPASDVSSIELNGAPLPAMRVVKSETSVRPLMERLLGTTRVVRDLEAATEAWRESNGAFHYVTLSGELLSQHGVYTGGYSNGNGDGKTPGSILGRRNQIADLHLALTGVQEQVAGISRKKGALQSEQTELEAAMQQAQVELRAQEVAIATHEGEFNALQNSERLLHQKIDTVMYEIQSLAAQEQEGQRKRAGLAAQAGECEGREQRCQAQVTDTNGRLEQLREQRDGANTVLTESRVALAAEEQVCASFQQQRQSLEERIRELTQVIEQRRGELSSFEGRK